MKNLRLSLALLGMVLLFQNCTKRQTIYSHDLAEVKCRKPLDLSNIKIEPAAIDLKKAAKDLKKEESIENGFIKTKEEAFSTFSIDVDHASYSYARYQLNSNQQPSKEVVRIEEMINYFDYDYPQPKDKLPFAIYTEVAPAPWNAEHQLVHIGIQGEDMAFEQMPNNNLVFLIDVSGSMDQPNKLGLLKSSFDLLVDNLRAEDKVSIIVYAGAAGMVLKPTSGNEKAKIKKALTKLVAGGSTAGGAGIELAYKTAKEQFIKNGNNRVILATDGDFNVGVSSVDGLEKLIETKREEGIFLSVLGFGMSMYGDQRLETLANKGNGNYTYIDNINEAKKVFQTELTGTLYTIAKDVKLQLEFNPTFVESYRLIGYENRMLAKKDFADDKKDAGELGAGHTVTGLYEIIPAKKTKTTDVNAKAFENPTSPLATSDDLLTLNLRYKKPEEDKSNLITGYLPSTINSLDKSSDNFRWSAAVAGFGMMLRDSKYKGDLSIDKLLALSEGAKGKDHFQYRAEFIELISKWEHISTVASK